MGFNIFALVLLKIHEKVKFATIITIMYYGNHTESRLLRSEQQLQNIFGKRDFSRR